jgi:hypothetical protein
LHVACSRCSTASPSLSAGIEKCVDDVCGRQNAQLAWTSLSYSLGLALNLECAFEVVTPLPQIAAPVHIHFLFVFRRMKCPSSSGHSHTAWLVTSCDSSRAYLAIRLGVCAPIWQLYPLLLASTFVCPPLLAVTPYKLRGECMQLLASKGSRALLENKRSDRTASGQTDTEPTS